MEMDSSDFGSEEDLSLLTICVMRLEMISMSQELKEFSRLTVPK